MISGTEAFLSRSLVLKESSTPGSSDELDKGSHNFPFKFEIKEENLPASQITLSVNIKYSVEAHLHKGLPVARVAFTYAGSGELVQSVSADAEKSVLFASGPIRLFVELESGVIHVGRMVKMRVNVENNTGRSLGLKAAIKEEHTFRSETASRRCLLPTGLLLRTQRHARCPPLQR